MGAGSPLLTLPFNPEKPRRQRPVSLQDWLTVFAFIDTHPSFSQDDIVQHFASKPDLEGPLKFTQSTLSRKIKKRPNFESQVNSNPTALDENGKREAGYIRHSVEEMSIAYRVSHGVTKCDIHRNEYISYCIRFWGNRHYAL